MIVVARHDLPTIDGPSIDVPMKAVPMTDLPITAVPMTDVPITALPMTAVPTTVRTGSDHEPVPAERQAAPTAESSGSRLPAGERSE